MASGRYRGEFFLTGRFGLTRFALKNYLIPIQTTHHRPFFVRTLSPQLSDMGALSLDIDRVERLACSHEEPVSPRPSEA
jgi:hypothetical protein